MNDSIEPPKSIEAEMMLIGSVLISESIAEEWCDRLKPKDFFVAEYGQLWAVIQELHREGMPPEVCAVSNRLKTVSSQTGEYWAEVLAVAMSYACPPHNFGHYAGMVLNYAYRREASYKLSQAAQDMRTETIELAGIKSTLRDILDDDPDEKRPSKLIIRTAGELIRDFPQLRRILIDGLVRLGEILNIIAPPKFGKSWLSLSLILSVACGLKWLGRFFTHRGNVLLVDNELHEETIASRLPRVAMALGLTPDLYEDNICIVSLRGKLMDLNALAFELMKLEPGSFDLIVLDAWYRLQPSGSDENSNGDTTRLYNLLEVISHRIGCAFVCIHHSTKGSQADKSVVDIGAGAGSQARAADCHMVLRPHEADDAFVVDAAVRSFPPHVPFVLRWDFPIFTEDPLLDPADLRKPRPRRNDSPSKNDVRQEKEEASLAKVMDAYANYPDGETQRVLRAKCRLSGQKFNEINDRLIADGLVQEFTTKKGRQTVVMYKLIEVGQAGQIGENPTCPTCPTERLEASGTNPPLFRGGICVPPDSPRLEDIDVFDVEGDFR